MLFWKHYWGKLKLKQRQGFLLIVRKRLKKQFFQKKIISQASSFNNKFQSVSIKSETFLWVMSKKNEKILKFCQWKSSKHYYGQVASILTNTPKLKLSTKRPSVFSGSFQKRQKFFFKRKISKSIFPAEK